MSQRKVKSQQRTSRREIKTALLYVMRPTSTVEHPVWDLLQLLHYYEGRNFSLPVGSGLHYSVISPSGETLLDTTLPIKL